MSDGINDNERDGSSSSIQTAESKALDSLSSGDEFLFNFIYPLAVEVFFHHFLFFNSNYRYPYFRFFLKCIFSTSIVSSIFIMNYILTEQRTRLSSRWTSLGYSLHRMYSSHNARLSHESPRCTSYSMIHHYSFSLRNIHVFNSDL